ncbi:MAG: STAS domain-containing protein [Cyanobacteriota bacterium]|nr:STAS domain-containing protein [Cyanobacteriota bacterium]
MTTRSGNFPFSRSHPPDSPAHPAYTSATIDTRAGTINDLQRLTVSLRGGFEQLPRCLLFTFTGQLDAYSDKQFSAFVASQRLGSGLPVVIDLSRIDFIDSSGLGVLVQLAKDCTADSVEFQIVGNARVKQTVKLVRLESFLHLQPDLDTALDSIVAA